ncbi:MAG: hypothetical protein R3A48_26625 [Polyangiales bacterium]
MRPRATPILLTALLGACGTPVGGGFPLPDAAATSDVAVVDAPESLDAPAPDVVAPATDVPPPKDAVVPPDVVAEDAPVSPDVPAPQDVVTPPPDAAACATDTACGVGRFCDASGACLPQRCTPNARQCVSTTRARICDNRGATAIDTDCASGQRCVDGQCLMNACTPNAARCSDAFTRAVCSGDGAMETAARCPTGQRCDAGACVAQACTPNAARCSDAFTRAVCSADGARETTTRCGTNQRCASGACVAQACAPSSVTCASATVRRVCDSSGSSFVDTACPAPSGASASCSGGTCGFTCAAARGDCDGQSANGCEVDLGSSAAHCGACGRACASGQSCVASVCTGGSTTGGWGHAWGAAGTDAVNGVAIDAAGNTVVVSMFASSVQVGSQTVSSAGSLDAVVASFAPNGATRWTQRVGGATNDSGTAVAVDGAGNVYACGAVTGTVMIGGTQIAAPDGFTETWVASWTSSGSLRWAQGFGGAQQDQCLGLAVDAAGTLWAAGNFSGTFRAGATTVTARASGDVFLLAQRASDGAPLRLRSFGGSSGTYFDAITAHGDGAVLAVHSLAADLDLGFGAVGNQGNSDAFLVRVNGSSSSTWQLRIGANNAEVIGGVGADASGNVYFAAQTSSTSLNVGGQALTFGVNDGYIASLTSAGQLRWVTPLGAQSPSNATEVPRAIAVRPDGTAWTVGTTNAVTFFAGSTSVPANGITSGFVVVTSAGGAVTAARTASITTGSQRPLAVAVSDRALAIAGEHTTPFTFEGLNLARPGSNTDAFVLNASR